MRALLLAAVLAAPGSLDTSFGGDGRVATPVEGGAPAVAAVEALPRGRTLVVGTVGDRRLVLLRYLPSGRLDRRFGRRGIASLDFGRDLVLGAAERLADGRLLIGGGLGTRGTPNQTAFLARLTPEGAVDPSFGEGAIVQTEFGGRGGDTITGLAAGPAGGIVAAASLHQVVSRAPPLPRSSRGDLGVARYDERGVLDPSFGEGGLVRIVADSEESLTSGDLVLQGDRIVVAASHSHLRGWSEFALRLLADGTPDPGFGTYQSRLYLGTDGSVRDLLVDPRSGNLLLVGSDYGGVAGSEYEWLGFSLLELPAEPAGGYRTVAQAHIPVPGREAWATSLALDRRGRRILGGAVSAPLNDRALPYGRPALGVARVLPNGRPDECFGRGGLARMPVRTESTIADVAVDARGRIVAAGPERTFGPTAPSFQLVRLHGGRCRR